MCTHYVCTHAHTLALGRAAETALGKTHSHLKKEPAHTHTHTHTQTHRDTRQLNLVKIVWVTPVTTLLMNTSCHGYTQRMYAESDEVFVSDESFLRVLCDLNGEHLVH